MDFLSTLVARQMSDADAIAMGVPIGADGRPDDELCTKALCDIRASIYGYVPSRPGNIIFTVLFFLSLILHLYQGIRWKSWAFCFAMTVGCLGEGIGYIGRVMLYDNPFGDAAFQIQIICLTIAPAFLAAGIYLTLKHSVIVFGAEFSRIKPRFYTWLFCGLDLVSIAIQAAGGGIAASSDNNEVGDNLMIAGLAFQVFTLAVFGIMALEYAWRVRQNRHHLNAETTNMRRTVYFKGTLAAIFVAYWTIMIRCIYRVAEMAGGWRNPIMQNEASFIVLDSVMCVVATLGLNAFHPGFLFRESSRLSGKQASLTSSDQDEAAQLKRPNAGVASV